jgi:HD-GYP domain-containing protein (c-di-GMP phosphodiesterase class II)
VSFSETALVNWLSSLALVVDLANGAPETTALRGTLVAAAAARELGLGEEGAAVAVYGALFRYLGCTSYALEEANVLGDEHVGARLLAPLEMDDYGGILRAVVRAGGPGESTLARARRLTRGAFGAPSFVEGYRASHCEGAVLLASRLDVVAGVRELLGALHERWDGDGGPARLAGSSIPEPARVVHVAREATVQFALSGSRETVVRCLERRAGAQLDPDMCRRLAASEAFLEAFTVEPLWDAVRRVLARHLESAFANLPSLDVVVEVFGDFADQKNPWFLGHARRVATLATGAAHELGLDPQTVTLLARAAWLHDVGRVSVPNRVWDTPGALGPIEWEKVRLHAYVGERICLHLDAKLAALVGQHHERADGSGYARGNKPDHLTSILCAADVCSALAADRPHRERLSDEERERVLTTEVREGRLRAEAVDAVLASLGARPAPGSMPPRSVTLSEREREVIMLVARGLSNKEVAQKLGISARTVQAHTIRAYDKLGVRTRAGAALRASELGLLD